MPIEAIGSIGSSPLSRVALEGIQSGEGANLPIPSSEPVEGTGKSFGQFLQDAISDVNKAQIHAGDMAARFAAGEPMDVHQVMIASQEAGVALNLALQVRNKALDAYQELMRVNL